FLLTVFFMLVSKFTTAEQVALMLPDPEQSRARVPGTFDRAVINCRLSEAAEGDGGVAYSLGPNPPDTLAAISTRLAAMKRDASDLKVVIRADRRLRYRHVMAAMREVTRNNIPVLNVAAIAGEGQ
ncbi:MAG: biopolymer transporter ExbD, partial [Planctomycetota bacterium]